MDRLVGGFGSDGQAREVAATQKVERVAFYGPHQAGIATPAQGVLYFATFDVATGARAGPLSSGARACIGSYQPIADASCCPVWIDLIVPM